MGGRQGKGVAFLRAISNGRYAIYYLFSAGENSWGERSGRDKTGGVKAGREKTGAKNRGRKDWGERTANRLPTKGGIKQATCSAVDFASSNGASCCVEASAAKKTIRHASYPPSATESVAWEAQKSSPQDPAPGL